MKFRLIAILLLLLLGISNALAFSGFPAMTYPSHMYGYESRMYDGPWGEKMVYGSYGYFPNAYGYYPYGSRPYGYIYTPSDLRYGGYVSHGYSNSY